MPKNAIKNNQVMGDGNIIQSAESITNHIYIMESQEELSYTDTYFKYIHKFDELDRYLFEELCLKKENARKYESIDLKFAKSIIDWIIGRTEFPNDNISKFYIKLRQDFDISEDDILYKRWKALIEYFKGNMQECLEIYDEIFESMKSVKIEQYLKDDILIDGRNIESMLEKNIYDNKYQNEIDQNKHKLANPVYDRIKVNMFENVHKNIFKIKNKSKNTQIWGYGIEQTCQDIQNLIYIIVFYGSITHLLLCRNLLYEVLYLYADATNDINMYTEAFKLLCMVDRSDNNRTIFNLYNWLRPKTDVLQNNDYINCIVKQEKSIINQEKTRYKCLIYDIWGFYLPDDIYIEHENYILNEIAEKYKENEYITNLFLQAVKKNMPRFNKKNKLFDLFTEIIQQKMGIYYREISLILSNIHVSCIKEKELTDEEYNKYIVVLDLLIPKMKEYSLSLIGPIVECKMRSCTEKYDEIIYEDSSNTMYYECFSKGNEYEFTKKIIKNIEEDVKRTEKNSGVYFFGATEYSLEKGLYIAIKKSEYSEKYILNNFLPLANTVLSSAKQSIYTKNKFLKMLSDMYLVFDDEKYRNEIIKISNNISGKYSNGCSFNERNEQQYEVYVYMYRYAVGLISIEELIDKYLELIIYDECLLEILKCVSIVEEKICKEKEYIKSQIMFLFNYCYNKNFDIDVRVQSYELGRILLKSKQKNKFISIIANRVKICEFMEARKIIELREYYNDTEKTKLKKLLLMNSNYLIRKITEIYFD